MVQTEDAFPQRPTAVIQWQSRHQLLIDHPEAFQHKQMQSRRDRLVHNAAEEVHNAETVRWHLIKANPNHFKTLKVHSQMYWRFWH